MIKEKLLSLIDIKIIIFLIFIVVVSGVFTLFIKDNVKNFVTEYKNKYYGYILSFVLLYSFVAFLGYNIFKDLSEEFLFYQITSTLFGVLHLWVYYKYFQEFNVKKIVVEILFASIVPLYSSLLFVILYTVLNGIHFTFLMCGHFILFVVPTGINIAFCFMMLIPPKIITTWTSEKYYKEISQNEMQDILLITLLIKKEHDEDKYTSIRARTPMKVDFGRLFFLATKGYNKQNTDNPIQLKMANRQNCNWVFFLQPKWHEPIKYVNALRDMASNGISENSIIICERIEKKNAAPEEKKKSDARVYGNDSKRNDEEQDKIDELKEEEEGPID